MGTPIDTNDLLRRIEFIERHLGIKQGVGESMRPVGVPFNWPPGPTLWPNSPPPPVHQGDTRCTKCGISFSDTMGYVCPRADCPTGLGGPTCAGGGL